MRDAEGERRREPDRPGDLGHRLRHHLLRRIEVGEDRGGALIIGLADLGRLRAARGPGQQPRAEPFLEPRDAPREDRLGKAHPFGGAAEGAGFDHADEGEDVEQVGRVFHIPQHQDAWRRASDNACRRLDRGSQRLIKGF